MANKILIICQGIHISKIIASILSNTPEECIILRSYYDINLEVRKRINKAIEEVLEYIENNLRFFQTISKIYEVKVDIYNPVSVIKSLESVIQNTGFFNYDPIIDLSAGPTPTNIGLYLFAVKNKIYDIHFSFPGERYRKDKASYLAQEDHFEENIEFARASTHDIPIFDLAINKIDDEIVVKLAEKETGRVTTLKELNILLEREGTSRNLMKLSRECFKLESLGLIGSDKMRKNKSIFITSYGRQYAEYNKYDKPKLKLIWQRPNKEFPER